MENRVLKIFKDGQVAWINELMQKCGVISSEQPVQEHTCIVTDAKKREYPDRPELFRKSCLKRLFLEGYGTTEDVACGSVIEKVNIVIICHIFFNVGVTLGS